MPEISVILPFYNAEKTLKMALRSIAEQCFTDFECLMVNNNSTDKSPEIANNFSIKDSRFRLLNESRQGVAYASSLGSNNAKAELIARMDADDYAFENRLRDQHDFMRSNPDVDAVFGKVEFGGDKTKAAGLCRYVKWNNSITSVEEILKRRFIESPVINPSGMWRKSSEEKAGGFIHGDFPEDYECWLRWIDKGMRIAKTNKYLLRWNDPAGRLTRNDPVYSTDSFYEIKSQYLARELKRINPEQSEVIVWGASRLMRRRAEKITKYGINISAWIDISEKRQLNRNLIHYKNIPAPGSSFILVYVPQEEIRSEIHKYLISNGYKEGKNFLLCA